MALKLDFSKVLVKDNTNRTTKAESDILQQANQIALRVTTEAFNALSNTVANHEASLSLQAQQIALRVASTDFNGATIASLINQSAAEVKIQASKITLEGLVTANSNFKILEDGSIEAVNAKLSGAITATKMVAPGLAYLYGEIGMTDNAVGFGLYDTRQGSQAFVELIELSDSNGIGFGLRDINNIIRYTAMPNSFSIKDSQNKLRIYGDAAMTRLYSPSGDVTLTITDAYVRVTKGGVTLANWG